MDCTIEQLALADAGIQAGQLSWTAVSSLYGKEYRESGLPFDEAVLVSRQNFLFVRLETRVGNKIVCLTVRNGQPQVAIA